MILVTDHSGVKRAALWPVVGAEKVVRYVAGGIAKADVDLTAELTVVNGHAAVLLRVDGEVDGVQTALNRNEGSVGWETR